LSSALFPYSMYALLQVPDFEHVVSPVAKACEACEPFVTAL
jgi:hypothetical protein